MKKRNKKFQKRGSNPLNKLSLFQKNDGKFSKKCPLSTKDAPLIDYKNINLLKKYVSDNGKILSVNRFEVSYKKLNLDKLIAMTHRSIIKQAKNFIKDILENKCFTGQIRFSPLLKGWPIVHSPREYFV